MISSKKLMQLAAILTLPLFGLTVSAQVPVVVSTTPSQNELNILTSSDITVTFDIEMDASTINDSTFVVHALTTGSHSGIISYDSPSKTATFTSDNGFAEGEVVTAILTTGIESSTNVPLSGSYVWTFTTSVSAGGGHFTLDSVYSTGTSPHAIFTGDFDNDGDFDLATVNFGADSITVLKNNGSGGFSDRSDYSVGTGTRYIFGADFDNDGYMDLATGNGGTDNVSVLLNNGDGTFATHVTYATGVGPHSIFCADLNGDGAIDIACANAFENTVSILLNNGDGTFVHDSAYNVAGVHPRSVYAADFDNDGDLDLATANLSTNSVSIFENIGGAVFSLSIVHLVGSSPRLVFSADINADNYMDLLVARSGSGNVSLLVNNGDGTFAPPSDISNGHTQYAVNASDFIQDGSLDIVSANLAGDNVTVLENNGSGSFALIDSAAAGDGPLSIATADFNGDGSLDIATADFFGHSISVLFNGVPAPTDRLIVPSISVQTCLNECIAIQPVQTELIQPIKGASIPLKVPENFVVCSVSTGGLITESWDIVVIDDDKWQDSGFIFVLFANTFGELIPTGVTTVFNIHFGAPAHCQENYFVSWDTALSTDPSRKLKYSDTLNQVILPSFNSSQNATEVVGYTPGDLDGDSNVTILDLTAYVDRIFRGGSPVCQIDAADLNGDCDGPDIADLTYMVDYIFRGGDVPMCGCIY